MRTVFVRLCFLSPLSLLLSSCFVQPGDLAAVSDATGGEVQYSIGVKPPSETEILNNKVIIELDISGGGDLASVTTDAFEVEADHSNFTLQIQSQANKLVLEITNLGEPSSARVLVNQQRLQQQLGRALVSSPQSLELVLTKNDGPYRKVFGIQGTNLTVTPLRATADYQILLINGSSEGLSLWAVELKTGRAHFLSRGSFSANNILFTDSKIFFYRRDSLDQLSFARFRYSDASIESLSTGFNFVNSGGAIQRLAATATHEFFAARVEGDTTDSFFALDLQQESLVRIKQGVTGGYANIDDVNNINFKPLVIESSNQIILTYQFEFSKTGILLSDGTVSNTFDLIDPASALFFVGHVALYHDSVDSRIYIGLGRNIYRASMAANSASIWLNTTNSAHTDNETQGIVRIGDKIVYTNGWVSTDVFSSDVDTPAGSQLIGSAGGEMFNRFHTMFQPPVLVGKWPLLNSLFTALYETDGTAGGTQMVTTGTLTAVKIFGDHLLYGEGTNLMRWDSTGRNILLSSPLHSVEGVYPTSSLGQFYATTEGSTRLVLYRDGVHREIVNVATGFSSWTNPILLEADQWAVVTAPVFSPTTFYMLRSDSATILDLSNLTTNADIVPAAVFPGQQSTCVLANSSDGSGILYVLEPSRVVF